ncbi:CoA transferase subunit A [Microbacterium sp.]|uniref:CoA transferase subunit A n=1 Tax=Microbacterium sp. TaxID=51671 RepID=UPI0039E440CC
MTDITRTSRIISVEDAAAAVEDGMTVAIGGFINSGHPMAVVRQLIKDGRKDLTVVGAASAGLETDLLIAAGVASHVITPYVGAEGFAGIGPAFRKAGQDGLIDIFELDEAHFYAGLRASAQRVPYNPWKAGVGTDLPKINPRLKEYRDPLTDELLIAVPAINIDVAFLHAATSDVYGNVQHNGTRYGDISMYNAATKTYVSVEKVVSPERIKADPLKTSIPGATGVIRAPYGAHPYSADGYYVPDAGHINTYLAAATAWLKTGDRAELDAYIAEYITGPADHADYLERIGIRTLLSLNEF